MTCKLTYIISIRQMLIDLVIKNFLTFWIISWFWATKLRRLYLLNFAWLGHYEKTKYSQSYLI